MKIIVNVIVIIFLFIGCSIKEKNIEQKSEPKISYSKGDLKIEVKEKLVEKELIVKEEKPLIKKVISEDVAVIFPSSVIGKYALEATNSINTYLLLKKKNFSVKVFDIMEQSKKSLYTALNNIKDNNIKKVIILSTKDSFFDISTYEYINEFEIYLPLIHQDDLENYNYENYRNIVFGSISYKSQFEKLISYKDNKKIIELYDNSAIGTYLSSFIDNKNIYYKKKIDDNNGNYKRFLKQNRFNNAVVILNTPIVKSSILLSTIFAQELEVDKIYSSQLNYSPLLFSLTQKQDRKKLIVANSIGEIPKELVEYNNIIGNNLLYSWVNYSSIVGVEYLISKNIDSFTDLKIKDNQIIYPVKLYSVGANSFKLLK
ncbi:MAG: hypothetical protein U9R37_08225 [Campylobacterota bacterium]|nr:hypothetical protein [Campylobacterota bacterium]